MTSRLSTIGKAVFILGLATFLLLGVFGMPHSAMNMGAGDPMAMSNCPLMSGQAAICNMNPLQHIAAWQSMFAMTVQQHGSDLLTLLLTLFALAIIGTGPLWSKRKHHLRATCSVTQRTKETLPPPLLQELFSSGILNPKLF